MADLWRSPGTGRRRNVIRRWFKPCPRCRGGYLLEDKDEHRRLVRCMDCRYALTADEATFLVQDIVLSAAAVPTQATVGVKPT
jgi:hypothetical protein